MKTVIRKGVFETNSSSTHSLSYVPKEDDEGKEGFTFECKSPASRLLMIKAQVNHCLWDLQYVKRVKDKVALVKAFYDVCVRLYCEREGVDPAAIEDHLLEVAKKTFYAIPERRGYAKYFKEYYHEESTDLCESFFECGPLVECNCLYESVMLFLHDFFSKGTDETSLQAKAEELLYGEDPFFCTEFYSGCILLDSALVF